MTEKENSIVSIGILKLGNIASSVLLEMLLDERADRLDVNVRTISSGAKLQPESINSAYKIFSDLDFDINIVATPNASLPAPQKIILKLLDKKKPLVVITDVLKKENKEEFEAKGIGYIIVKPDAMIGARREFLDPVEMAIYNSDLLKVLSIGGALSILYQSIDSVIQQIKLKKEITLPQITITSKDASTYAKFKNPYAEAKARAALEIAETAAKINSEGCFKVNERLDYIPQVASAHEMMRTAAKLADEAREIEKSNNQVLREPHAYSGEVQQKRTLTEKPDSKYE
ncbi:MAG: F420-dependent methylenetetrahydromethanopterin dehydrogenase [Asgard group archaeon]|nr:F420-dependent methylenetetrahydromethanopterin dehydrogenase [Asgard group archaeon]